MSFVPGFDIDVFVSYATANNQELIQGRPGWVTSFRDILRKLLDEGLVRRNASEVWMDYKLRGNDPFDEQLRATVTTSAVFVIVLSNAYLNSPWCQKELEIFLEKTHNGHDRSGCIFLVHYEPVPYGLWPKGLQGLSDEKYRFFQQEREGTPSKPLGYPVPNPEHHASYYDRLIDLRAELSAQLEKMKDAKPKPESVIPTVPAVPHEPGSPAVYLAEVTGDTLYDQRRLVKSHLEQVQLRVLPAKSYRRTPVEYVQDLDADLAPCMLFVQMLGRFPTGQEGLQHERARAAGLEILRWRSRDLKLDDVPDATHHALLSGIDVKELDFDELKRTIVERMKILAVQSSRPPDAEGRYILVDAFDGDTLAETIVTQLNDWNVCFDMVKKDDTLEVLTKGQRPDAVMVLYGKCTDQSHQDEWAHDKLREFRKLLLTHDEHEPAFAVCIEPPEKKKALKCKPPRVTFIDSQQLRAFIQNLPHGEVSK
jgi:hypothetical protein